MIVHKIIHTKKKPTSVKNVAKLLTNAHTLLHGKAFVLEKKFQIYIQNMKKPLISVHILLNIRDFILNKSIIHAITVENLSENISL